MNRVLTGAVEVTEEILRNAAFRQLAGNRKLIFPKLGIYPVEGRCIYIIVGSGDNLDFCMRVDINTVELVTCESLCSNRALVEELGIPKDEDPFDFLRRNLDSTLQRSKKITLFRCSNLRGKRLGKYAKDFEFQKQLGPTPKE